MSFKPLTSLLLTPFGLGSSISPIYAQCPWITNSASIGDPSTYTIFQQDQKVQSDTANGLWVFELKPNIRTALRFLGYEAANPNNGTALFRAWFGDEARVEHAVSSPALESEFLAMYGFDLALTCGNALLVSSSALHPGGTNVAKWIDTIVASPDHTVGGITVKGDEADCVAEATFDNASHRYLYVGMQCVSGLDGIRPLIRQY